MIEAVVLDLDDTLYLERDYVRSGFARVARALEELGVAGAGEAIGHLWTEFESGRRGDAFDSLARSFPLDDRVTVAELVDLYRVHRPTISLLEPNVIETLAKAGVPLGLISDGLVDTQMRKVEALGLAARFDVVVLTGTWGREYWKPHPRAFEVMETRLGLAGERLAYVADNPAKDFIAPNQRGWTSIRVRIDGQLHYRAEPGHPHARPHMEVSALGEVSELLGLCRSGSGGDS